MKKFFVSLIACSVLLSGCSLFGDLSNNDSSTAEDSLKSFEFVTDSNMAIDDSDSEHPFYLLTMYVDETYQLKTNVDDKLGNNYHFDYSGFDETKISVSSSGLVSAEQKCVDSVTVKLIRNKDSKKIDSKYFVVNAKEQNSEYANITINDSTLGYDEATRTYSLSLQGGDSYQIATSVSYNVAFNRSFALADNSYSSFMSVSASGYVTTQRVDEDKDGQIVIKTTSTDNTKVYDTIYLNVHIEKNNEVITNTFEVTNLVTGTKLNDGDSLSLYANDSLTFGVKYNNQSKYGVVSVSNSDVLALENNLNKITGIAVGDSDVTFSYEDKSLTIHIAVIKNALTEIYSKNGSDDFVIVNGQLLFLGRMFAKYQSGLEIDITNSSDLIYVISNVDSTHKSVTFTYANSGETKSVTYRVLYFVSEEYSSNNTAYDFSDYFNNRYRGNAYVLPKEGDIHMLVIPVWFTNSTSFFREDQKQEILTDLEYVFNATREDGNFYSVKQFYELESSGKVTITSTISEFYECSYASTHYGDTIESDIVATHDLCDSAIQWYFNNHTAESINDYDANNDGKVDAVSLVYAATYYGTIGDQNGTTAFQFKDVNASENRKYNNGSFSPLGGIYGFKKSSTGTLPKDSVVTDLSAYYPATIVNSGSRTIIHETAHMFGFDDLYEDNHATTKYSPAGKFSMQDSDYGGHDPYQMNLVGWSKPQIYDASDYEIGETITLSINDFATSGNNILLTREFNASNSLFDEYMLLELLAPTGLNKYDAKNSSYKFIDPGIRLWHVNSILEDMSDSGKETSEISNSKWTNLKYSNNDQSSEYDLTHWIRNNKEEPYDTTSTVKDSYGLFKSGDHFDMGTYQSQFVNGDKLDNKEKLGWEFDVNSIYQTIDDEYGAIITLTRVENTRTDFEMSARINKDIATQPTEDGNDYANTLLGDDELFSLIYNFNNATAPSYYTQGKPISYKGVCLFASPDGNGGSLVITIKDKAGYNVRINTISITYSLLTKASVTAIVGGSEVAGTSFEGPYNDLDGYNERGLTFEVNSNSITIQNKYTAGTDYWSVLAIYSLSIEYHIEKI